MSGIETLPPGVRLSDSRAEYGSASALPLLVVENERCRAVLAFQGAQLLSFAPKDGPELLWLSPRAHFAPGQAIRGGIPLCLPWFGVNRRRPELPKHGWFRTRPWQLREIRVDASGAVSVVMGVASQPGDLREFPWAFEAEVEYRLASELQCTLQLRNASDTVMPLSFAMHSYFVADVAAAKVFGLGSGRCLDNTDSLRVKQQPAPQGFEAEVDRVFEGVGGSQRLEAGEHAVQISGQACDTLVIWNPGAELAEQLADVGDGYRDYVCVERGMAFADEVALAPGDEYRASMTIALLK